MYFECSGIGIVNAIEVVNAFPEEDGLSKFREWIESPDPTILKKFDAETGSSAKKRGPKVGDKGLNCSKSNTEEVSASDLNMSQAQEQQQSATYMQDIKQIFMDKHVIVMSSTIFLLLYMEESLWDCSVISNVIIYFLLLTEKCEQELAYSFFFSK